MFQTWLTSQGSCPGIYFDILVQTNIKIVSIIVVFIMDQQLNYEACDAPTHSLEEHNEQKFETNGNPLAITSIHCEKSRLVITLEHLVSSLTPCNQ